MVVGQGLVVLRQVFSDHSDVILAQLVKTFPILSPILPIRLISVEFLCLFRPSGPTSIHGNLELGRKPISFCVKVSVGLQNLKRF